MISFLLALTCRAEPSIGRRGTRTSVRLMEHASKLDLYQFEDPAFYDQLERARQQTTGRIGLLAQLFGLVQDLLTLGSLGAPRELRGPRETLARFGSGAVRRPCG